MFYMSCNRAKGRNIDDHQNGAIIRLIYSCLDNVSLIIILRW